MHESPQALLLEPQTLQQLPWEGCVGMTVDPPIGKVTIEVGNNLFSFVFPCDLCGGVFFPLRFPFFVF